MNPSTPPTGATAMTDERAAAEERWLNAMREIKATRAPEGWFASRQIDWRRNIGRLHLRFSMRRADGLMGRFGGGWNWKIGIQGGSTTVIFSLLIADLTLSWRRDQ